MDDKVYKTVYVAYWGGQSHYMVCENYEVDGALKVAKGLAFHLPDDYWQKGFRIPVAIYYVEVEDVTEISLQGPQLMVRGQPVACKRLTVIKP